MELKSVFNAWAKGVTGSYASQQWLLSKWELFEGIPWPREKHEILLKSITEGLQLNPRDTLVDLGCGGGWILSALSSRVNRAFGLDFSPEMLRFAQKTISERLLVCGDIGHLPLRGESFDKVMAYYVFLNFVDDRYVERGILEIMRVLKKGGRALIGQLPDQNGSALYDAAKNEHLEFCRTHYSLGKNNRDVHFLPLRLFDKEKLGRFLDSHKISYRWQSSFNPFYRSGKPPLIDWRFDLILGKK